MPGTGHTPNRRCIGCGTVRAKAELARFTVVVRGEDWVVVRDDRSTLPGRGLYLCERRACFERARARRAFARAARVPAGRIAVDDEIAEGFQGEG